MSGVCWLLLLSVWTCNIAQIRIGAHREIILKFLHYEEWSALHRIHVEMLQYAMKSTSGRHHSQKPLTVLIIQLLHHPLKCCNLLVVVSQLCRVLSDQCVWQISHLILWLSSQAMCQTPVRVLGINLLGRLLRTFE